MSITSFDRLIQEGERVRIRRIGARPEIELFENTDTCLVSVREVGSGFLLASVLVFNEKIGVHMDSTKTKTEKDALDKAIKMANSWLARRKK